MTTETSEATDAVRNAVAGAELVSVEKGGDGWTVFRLESTTVGTVRIRTPALFRPWMVNFWDWGVATEIVISPGWHGDTWDFAIRVGGMALRWRNRGDQLTTVSCNRFVATFGPQSSSRLSPTS